MSIYAWMAAAVTALVLLAGAYWKGRVDESANTRICEARIADRDALIDAQNEAIRKLRAEAIAKMAASKKALDSAKANTARNRESIAQTLALQPQGDECKAAEALLGTVK